MSSIRAFYMKVIQGTECRYILLPNGWMQCVDQKLEVGTDVTGLFLDNKVWLYFVGDRVIETVLFMDYTSTLEGTVPYEEHTIDGFSQITKQFKELLLWSTCDLNRSGWSHDDDRDDEVPVLEKTYSTLSAPPEPEQLNIDEAPYHHNLRSDSLTDMSDDEKTCERKAQTRVKEARRFGTKKEKEINFVSLNGKMIDVPCLHLGFVEVKGNELIFSIGQHRSAYPAVVPNEEYTVKLVRLTTESVKEAMNQEPLCKNSDGSLKQGFVNVLKHLDDGKFPALAFIVIGDEIIDRDVIEWVKVNWAKFPMIDDDLFCSLRAHVHFHLNEKQKVKKPTYKRDY
jgi:hypothetical protein